MGLPTGARHVPNGSLVPSKLGGPRKGSVAPSVSRASSIRSALPSESIADLVFPPALGWTHCAILMRVANPAARGFYEIEAVREAWSTRELERQIGALLTPASQGDQVSRGWRCRWRESRSTQHSSEVHMIGTFVTFRYPDGFSAEKLHAIAAEAQHKFEGMPGLRSKAFTVDAAAKQAVNFYVWQSREAADAFFTPQLVEAVTALYGARPDVRFVEIAALVDNAKSP
ncbi:MAG: DUF1016 N-terminal domain-containing protein [Polyangiales bacterium]